MQPFFKIMQNNAEFLQLQAKVEIKKRIQIQQFLDRKQNHAK
jgi:hypothetical protein